MILWTSQRNLNALVEDNLVKALARSEFRPMLNVSPSKPHSCSFKIQAAASLVAVLIASREASMSVSASRSSLFVKEFLPDIES